MEDDPLLWRKAGAKTASHFDDEILSRNKRGGEILWGDKRNGFFMGHGQSILEGMSVFNYLTTAPRPGGNVASPPVHPVDADAPWMSNKAARR